MATLTFTYDTGAVPTSRILDAWALRYNYQATVPDPGVPGQIIPNPETKAAFAKRILKEQITAIVREVEAAAAAKTASDAVVPIVLT